MPQVQAQPHLKAKRSGRLLGFTDKVTLNHTSGEKRSFYVTVNSDETGPRELFIRSGKAGEEIMADAQALGKLVSTCLQHGVPAEAVIVTLRGIDGGMVGRYRGQEVGSKADLIAVALESALH